MPKRETPVPVISVFLPNANELSVVRGPHSDSRGVRAYVESVTSVCYSKARRACGARAFPVSACLKLWLNTFCTNVKNGADDAADAAFAGRYHERTARSRFRCEVR